MVSKANMIQNFEYDVIAPYYTRDYNLESEIDHTIVKEDLNDCEKHLNMITMENPTFLDFLEYAEESKVFRRDPQKLAEIQKTQTIYYQLPEALQKFAEQEAKKILSHIKNDAKLAAETFTITGETIDGDSATVYVKYQTFNQGKPQDYKIGTYFLKKVKNEWKIYLEKRVNK